MSIGSLTTAATASLTALLFKRCQRQVPTLDPSTGETWANSGSVFMGMYEESSPEAQGALDFEAGGGYGYDFWMKPDQTLDAGNRIVVDGRTFKVLKRQKPGAPGPLKRIRTQELL